MSGITRQPLNVAGFRRGSSGYAVLGGVNLRLAGTLFGEISAGCGHQDPIDDHFQPIDGPLVNGDLIWMPSPLTKLEFLARSEIDETTLVDSSAPSTASTNCRCNTLSGAISCSASTAPTRSPTLSAIPRSTGAPRAELTAEYYFNPILSVYGALRAHGFHEHAGRDEQFRRGRGAARAEAQAVRMA